MAEHARDVRDELAALRIDRGRAAPGPPRRQLWIAGAGAAVALAVAGTALLRWWAAPLRVEVAFATRSEPGAAVAGPVLSGSGYVVTGEKYVAVGVRIPGRIDRYFVDESDHVTRDQPLVQLDDRDYRAALARDEARLRVAEATVELRRKEIERMRQLRRADVASQAQLDVKEQELSVAVADGEQLRAEVDQARVNL